MNAAKRIKAEKKKKPKFKPDFSKSRAPDSPALKSPAPNSRKWKKGNASKEEKEEEPEVPAKKLIKVNGVPRISYVQAHLTLNVTVLQSKTDHLGVRN